jgi:imidazole glycerol-phosphate synthase subunit HisH
MSPAKQNNRRIVIIDYGAGNLRSVANAIMKLGYNPTIANVGAEVDMADVVILPGVGAAAAAMQNLNRLNLAGPLCRYIAADRPFLGVCLGMQVLLSRSEEDGSVDCLGVIPGKVTLLPSDLKTPHMGWNQVRQTLQHPVFAGIPDMTNFYFVHSYYAVPDDKAVILGETDYGIGFCSAIARNNLVATQFHPEKSGEPGLLLYRNFLNLALR